MAPSKYATGHEDQKNFRIFLLRGRIFRLGYAERTPAPALIM